MAYIVTTPIMVVDSTCFNGSVRDDSDQPNITQAIHWEGTFSIHYTDVSAVTILILLSILIVWTIFGNLLVWIALWKFKPLQTINNYLIGNLAISDFLLAITVLPMSVANDVLGYWVFGKAVCIIWLSVDVLYCTASIWSLCIIGIDRYTATIYPLWYRQNQSVRRVALYVAGVWVFSILICIPPLMMWDQGNASEGYKEDPTTNTYQCILYTSKSYVMYSSSGSFTIPFILILFLYVRIFVEIRKRGRKLHSNAGIHREGSFETSMAPGTSPEHEDKSGLESSPCIEKADTDKRSYNYQQKADTDKQNNYLKSPESGSKEDSGVKTSNVLEVPTASNVTGQHNAPSVSNGSCDSNAPSVLNGSCDSNATPTASNVTGQNNAPSVSNGSCDSNATRMKKIMGRLINRTVRSTNGHQTSRFRRFVRREQRATKRMAVVVGCFFGCWMPFLFMYVIRSFCLNCDMHPELVKLIVWLGYANSAINPLLYTIFNLDFRQAFKQLLCCESYSSTRGRHF